MHSCGRQPSDVLRTSHRSDGAAFHSFAQDRAAFVAEDAIRGKHSELEVTRCSCLQPSEANLRIATAEMIRLMAEANALLAEIDATLHPIDTRTIQEDIQFLLERLIQLSRCRNVDALALGTLSQEGVALQQQIADLIGALAPR